MEHEVVPGELDPGDVITLPGSNKQLLVKQILLGKGGFILNVSPVEHDAPETERLITLTAATHFQLHIPSLALKLSSGHLAGVADEA